MKTLVIETLNNQPGHVRDVRVVMNHVRVVCPILLEREQIIIRFYFVLKFLLENIIIIDVTHFPGSYNSPILNSDIKKSD